MMRLLLHSYLVFRNSWDIPLGPLGKLFMVKLSVENVFEMEGAVSCRGVLRKIDCVDLLSVHILLCSVCISLGFRLLVYRCLLCSSFMWIAFILAGDSFNIPCSISTKSDSGTIKSSLQCSCSSSGHILSLLACSYFLLYYNCYFGLAYIFWDEIPILTHNYNHIKELLHFFPL